MVKKPDSGWMTIEELSMRSGVTTRNIRSYQSRGLLPAPLSRPGERSAFYTVDHLTRLRLISRLQARGFSLAGIADLLSAWSEGKSIEHVLGLESAIAEAESADQEDSILLTERELKANVPHGVDADEALKKLVAVGLVVPHAKGYRLRHPKLYELGVDASRAGIPFDALLEEHATLQEDMHRVALRFVALFANHVLGPFFDAGMPAARLPEIVEQMKRLRQLAIEATVPLIRQALADEIEAAAQARLPAPT
jgi:DNA-binding transcriptional MerR regulator